MGLFAEPRPGHRHGGGGVGEYDCRMWVWVPPPHSHRIEAITYVRSCWVWNVGCFPFCSPLFSLQRTPNFGILISLSDRRERSFAICYITTVFLRHRKVPPKFSSFCPRPKAHVPEVIFRPSPPRTESALRSPVFSFPPFSWSPTPPPP